MGNREMEIVSEKIDEKILRILQRRFKHLQLPLGSLYELQQFIISLEGSYTLDNLTKIVLHEDGIYLEVDKYQIEKLVSNPIDEIEKISRGLSKTSVYGIFLTGVGLLSMYAGLSAGKYETVDFCFQPKILHSTQASEYCKSGQTVFRTSPKYLAGKDSLMPAPQFLQDDVDKFLIPAKGRRIVGKNKPTNASYLWLSGVSVLFTSAGYWLFSRTHERYQLEFPKYFGNLKTYLLNTQLESQANQEINKTLANHRANFLVDSLVGDANTRISSFGKNYQSNSNG
jgi:hypothetical protein